MKGVDTLRQELTQKLSHMSESRLREALHFVDFLATREKEEQDPILRVAGCLSGSPLSPEQIEEELYGKDQS